MDSALIYAVLLFLAVAAAMVVRRVQAQRAGRVTSGPHGAALHRRTGRRPRTRQVNSPAEPSGPADGRGGDTGDTSQQPVAEDPLPLSSSSPDLSPLRPGNRHLPN